jgi:hypothetical protein
MSKQNYKNHTQLVPAFHLVTVPLLFFVFIGSIVNLVHSVPGNFYSASLLVALSFATLLLAFISRLSTLKVQDRAIRAEENFRHYIATGQPLDSRLTIQQIIALRFVGDNEYGGLSKRAVDENMSAKEIKLAIQNWKGDYHRA